jgi:3-dehydroquinate synthase
MDIIQQRFQVSFEYPVVFTEALFEPGNPIFKETLLQGIDRGVSKKLLFVIDHNILAHFPELDQQINRYFEGEAGLELVSEKVVVTGGEIAKNDPVFLDRIIEAVNLHKIDRHSFIVAIGGGSVLDLTGYAAAIAHRGIKIIRIPTTVLSQNDSGVGVKNGINYQGKKNFLGTFAPPFAVFNDYEFLTTLSDRDWRAGISEAIKVALIKDRAFFEWLEAHAEALVGRDRVAMRYLIKRCAELHMEHIGGGDPFEFGSSRPLDFGHWSAHKLEQISEFRVLHGEAVAMGIALDSVYSGLSGTLPMEESERVVRLLCNVCLPLQHQQMELDRADHPIFKGLEEFREHLGGRLTIMLLEEIGRGYEVHELDIPTVMKASAYLKDYQNKQSNQTVPC